MQLEAYKSKGFILIILLIIISILIVFTFFGVYGRLPNAWEWVGIVMAGIGIALATPSTLQMFWGRPIIKIEYGQIPQGNERSLQIFLNNQPIKNRLLKIFGVKRETVQSLTAEIRISEAGSKKIIVPIRHVRLFPEADIENKGSYQITLPPTYSVSAAIMVVMWDDKEKKGVILGDEIRNHLLLESGYYIMQILLFIDGIPMEINNNFIIGIKADDLAWVKSNTKS
jgi:hypothetical protein